MPETCVLLSFPQKYVRISESSAVCTLLAYLFRVEQGQLYWVQGLYIKNDSSQGQNLGLNDVCVPCSEAVVRGKDPDIETLSTRSSRR